MPKRYVVFKWVIYAVATFLLLQVQTWALDYVELWGVTPFLAPMLVGVVASYEGSLAGPLFALVFGVLCDLGTVSPAAAVFTFIFTAAALVAAVLSSYYDVPLPEKCVLWGEVDLNGQIRPVSGQDIRMKQAMRLGYNPILCPENAKSRGLATVADLQRVLFRKG